MSIAPIPTELQGLTMVEQMLIARVHPVMRIYQVKAHGSRGQFHYKGHAINIEQDIKEIVKILPQSPEALSVLIVRRESVCGYADFRVRRKNVLYAPRWLSVNNPLYADVQIDMHGVQALPVDGDISNDLPFFEDGGISDESIEADQIEESAVPLPPKKTHFDAIQQTLNWPTANFEPVNEYRQSGYIPLAFPHLFPDGKPDFLDFSRNITVSFREWCEFLMRSPDHRFAQDLRFRFHCINTMQRHDATRQSTIFAKKNDFTCNIQQLSLEVQRNSSLLKRLLSWGFKIRGTSVYWYQRRLEL
ncbi:uncharacterized protein LOC105664038 [Megachile rotundata]|uniref:uncharacterized protein LOC105664038 n=1 Tax=Megachile rotundata TaxID=143995 RepID=UPI003FD425D2